jgi:DNA-binding beta-propeller fold protein YncE
VYVLNAETGAVQHTIPGFGMPYRIGITPDGKTAVVSDPGAEKIHLVDVASHTVRSVIAVEAMAGVAASPQGVTVSRDGTTAFVTLKAVGREWRWWILASARIVGMLTVGEGQMGWGTRRG